MIQLFNNIPFLKQYGFFEINFMMKSIIYPGLFHMALHISRLIDVAPETELKGKLLNTQRELTKSLLACEIICTSRNSDEKWLEEKNKEETKEEGKEESKEEHKVENEKENQVEGMVLRSGTIVPPPKTPGNDSKEGAGQDINESCPQD